MDHFNVFLTKIVKADNNDMWAEKITHRFCTSVYFICAIFFVKAVTVPLSCTSLNMTMVNKEYLNIYCSSNFQITTANGNGYGFITLWVTILVIGTLNDMPYSL